MHLLSVMHGSVFSCLSLNLLSYKTRGFPGGAGGGEPTCQRRRQMRVPSLGQEDPLEEEMATHSSILAWRISWSEEPGGLQTMGKDRVRHDSSDLVSLHTYFVSMCNSFLLSLLQKNQQTSGLSNTNVLLYSSCRSEV